MKIPVLFENKEFYEKEKYFSQFGSVLNLVQFYFRELPDDDYEFSKFVAQEAIKTLKIRNSKFYKKLDNQSQSQYYLNLGFYGNKIQRILKVSSQKEKK